MTTETAPSSIVKLKAEDAEDLKIVAACLQDAIVSLTDIAYWPDQQRFVMVVNRFKWEAVGPDGQPQGRPSFERTFCAVSVLGVTAVRRRGIDLLDRGRLLNFLTMTPAEDGLHVLFAGNDAVIHLLAPHWRCLIEDVGTPWPTATIPSHLDIDLKL
jgi:hypothetical protein